MSTHGLAFHQSFFCLAWLSLILVASAQPHASAAPPNSELELTVTDEQGRPINGAEAQVMIWTGKFQSVGEASSTDQAGKTLCVFPYSDSNFYLKVTAKDYAFCRAKFQIEAGQRQTLNSC